MADAARHHSKLNSYGMTRTAEADAVTQAGLSHSQILSNRAGFAASDPK
jgi:hypothetical protein